MCDAPVNCRLIIISLVGISNKTLRMQLSTTPRFQILVMRNRRLLAKSSTHDIYHKRNLPLGLQDLLRYSGVADTTIIIAQLQHQPCPHPAHAPRYLNTLLQEIIATRCPASI